MDEIDSDNPKVVQLEDVEIDKNYAIIISLAAFILSAFCAFLGQQLSASSIGGATLMGLVSLFIKGTLDESLPKLLRDSVSGYLPQNKKDDDSKKP
jgi:hypothetical protein